MQEKSIHTALDQKKIKNTQGAYSACLFFFFAQTCLFVNIIFYFVVKKIQIIPASLFYSTAIICLICAKILLDL